MILNENSFSMRLNIRFPFCSVDFVFRFSMRDYEND